MALDALFNPADIYQVTAKANNHTAYLGAGPILGKMARR